MFGVAVTRGHLERPGSRRLSAWTQDYLRKAAVADLGCAVVGVFAAAQLLFGHDVTGTYLALSFTVPVLWVAAIWLAGGYDVRFTGAGPQEFRKRLHRRHAAGQCLLNMVAVGHELAVANLIAELHRDRYYRPALPDEAEKYAEHVRPRPVAKAGPYRPVAGQQAIRAVLGAGAARPAVGQELIFSPSTCRS